MQFSSSSFRASGRPHPSPGSSAPNLQQLQIQDLERKVDMILLHNSKLMEEKDQLQQLLELASRRQHFDARGDSGQLLRLRRELEVKSLELQQLDQAHLSEKESICAQLDQLTQEFKLLSSSHQRLALQNQELVRKLDRAEADKQRDISFIRQELENQIYENSLKKEIQHKEQLRNLQDGFNKRIQQKTRLWQDEKAALEEQRMNTIIQMQEKMQKQQEKARKTLEDQFEQTVSGLQDQAEEKTRKIRDQSQKYVKMVLSQYKQSEANSSQQLKNQIESLRNSLEERQRVIESLLKPGLKVNHNSNQYYQEVQELRQRIKSLTESFFKQSEILKIKMALKHDLDIRELAKVYSNRIEVLSHRISILDQENAKLRQRFQQQIRSKMRQRQKFQIQASKLKNYIRKMKIELESYGKEMRLNIEGIRDQANSFSMSILGELGTEKNKKNFYEEEMRKMRQVLELKDRENEASLAQSQQKAKFYQDKLNMAKSNLQELSDQLDSRQRAYRNEIESLRENSKSQLKKQKSHFENQQQQMQNQIVNLKQQLMQVQQKLKQSKLQKIAVTKDYERISKQLQENKAYIETLKLQMQMAGDRNFTAERNELKSHYQRIIEQLQHDKNILKETNSLQNSQISQLVTKYKVLERSIEQTMSTMKKKTQLENRVVELGQDNNLVKNLAQVFKKEEVK